MALPSSRNTVYAPLTEVQSADLNDLQDFIIQQRWENREKFLGFAGAAITATTALICNNWRGTAEGTNEIDVDSGDSGESGPFIRGICTGGSDKSVIFLNHQSIGGDDGAVYADLDESILKLECGVSVPGLDIIGGDFVNIYIGFHSDPDQVAALPTAGTPEYAMFSSESDANWQYNAGAGGVETTADTGEAVPIAAASNETRQMLRVEYYGVNTPLGVTNGDATVRFYIDDVLIVEISDGNVPVNADGSKLGPFFHIDDTGGVAGDVELTIGPLFLTHMDHRY